MIYHLFIVTTDNEIREIIADSEHSAFKGFHYRNKDDVILPVYMIIEDGAHSYYIPQYELMRKLNLTTTDILVFLNDCREKKLISLQLYNSLNYCGDFAGYLTDKEKQLLNNLSIEYKFVDIDHDSNPIYKVTL